MTLFSDVLAWFGDSDHWNGPDGVPVLFVQHVLLTVVALVMSAVVGLPLAVWLGHRHRGGTLAVNLTNIGRAIPIVALLSLLALGVFGTDEFGPFGRSGVATLVTLALFALPPIVTNTYTAMVTVDADVVEAARGMGMSGRDVVRRVELPLAAPLIVSGLRLAVVQVWATATIAAIVAGPGLGRIIVHGYVSFQTAEVVAGSLIVALVALGLELGLTVVQRVVDPVPTGGR
ncbi:ABC transporter permease [Marmoricola sp. RAF53]|uniref:ABC transporter permease n=1 Tax=Marmoricola sp. RAF53 TaxID=3233059 RepID=UPI003F978094